MDCTKIVPAYLYSPCPEFSNGGFGIVVALLVRQGIYFSCASMYRGSNLAVFDEANLILL